MRLYGKNKNIILLSVILLLAIAGIVSAEEKIIELEFSRPPVSDSDSTRTLQSLVEVRKISETYATGGLYLLTHYGDREELFQKENQKAIYDPYKNQTWRYCSIFSAASENSVIMGRNWDNQNVGSIIVNLYWPPGGYASISFTRAIDVGFPMNVGLGDFVSGELGNRLLLTPFYAFDGINEQGLTVAVAGVRQTTVKPRNGKESVFITYLIRKILDQTKNVEEAVELVESCVPFVFDVNTLNCHLFVTEASGKSVTLEYIDNEWKKIYPDKSWQVLTNKPVYKVSGSTLKDQCWRYRSISKTLENTEGNIDWKAGLGILRDVEQKGTTWSVVYCPSSLELYFSVYQSRDKIYHLKGF